jgi:hypothetical protein
MLSRIMTSSRWGTCDNSRQTSSERSHQGDFRANGAQEGIRQQQLGVLQVRIALDSSCGLLLRYGRMRCD